jgi:hypothetical protein
MMARMKFNDGILSSNNEVYELHDIVCLNDSMYEIDLILLNLNDDSKEIELTVYLKDDD